MRDAQPSVVAALEARVAKHPWRMLGTAFLLGAWLGLEPPHVPRSRFARAAVAMVGSLTLRVVREIALGNLAEHAIQAMPRGAPDTSDAPIR
jgi:hypothetical protein